MSHLVSEQEWAVIDLDLDRGHVRVREDWRYDHWDVSSPNARSAAVAGTASLPNPPSQPDGRVGRFAPSRTAPAATEMEIRPALSQTAVNGETGGGGGAA
jgi:hypothetical protein